MNSATTPAVPAGEISDALLTKYAVLVYERTGIRISPQKKTLLSNRLKRRLKGTGIESFERYFDHLRKLKPDDPEWDQFLQEITTHETYLFRDEAQWEWLRNVHLPERIAQARAGGPASLRIWSAACSTGDEAMTIASCIAATLPNLSGWTVRIVGTDIGIGAIEQAKAAVFGERAMKLVPDDYKRRFFTKAASGNIWQAKPVLTEMTQFTQHNLMEAPRGPKFDLVFLKNVLIYFDAASKGVVLKHVRDAIVPGGLLIAGAAEGVSDLLKDFERVQPWLFRRPTKTTG
jgi:chemotaxis protein methyltransferase CheR